MTEEGNRLEDGSKDRSYFILTPQIVWANCRDPYEYALWNVVKMIAGESGECYLSTPQLASLSMMSVGKVTQCRQFLIDEGLLQGEIRRDAGYPQPVWHLRIPDLWSRNLAWRSLLGDNLLARIEYKEQQKERSPGECSREHSPGERGTSPGEQGTSPGEQGTPPGETKKNQKENQKEEPTNASVLLEKLTVIIERNYGPNQYAHRAQLIRVENGNIHIAFPDEIFEFQDSRQRKWYEEALAELIEDPPALIFVRESDV